MSNNFSDVSYELHKSQYEKINNELADLWSNKTSVDYWRHERMYNCLDALIESYKAATWLTVGDGRYGTDANYIIGKGVKNVMASDIAETFLKIAKKHGFINAYSVENVEKLSYEDESFDFIVCKEAYHHFPRPMVALYEMLRVAKNGVVLIEPRDFMAQSADYISGVSFSKFKQELKNIVKNIIGKKNYYEFGNYEPVGNYVFTISEREIEKVALGLNFDVVAFKGLNDYYLEGCEEENILDNGPFFQSIKDHISKADNRVRKGKSMPELLVAIIFKKIPNNDCIVALEKNGYNIKVLPKNPYII